MSISTAFKAFFSALFNSEASERIAKALAGESAPSLPAPEKKKTPTPPDRSPAVTLLATLQREARLLDFLMEPLDEYSDDQVGAAVRDIHRDTGETLKRLFAIEPVLAETEGETVDVPEGFDSGVYHLTGNIGGTPPLNGELIHAGWKVTKTDLPEFAGTKGAAKIVAPAEVEIR